MNREQIQDIANFLGDDITDEQRSRLMDQALMLSIAARELLYNSLDCEFYADISQHNAEMGGLFRY